MKPKLAQLQAIVQADPAVDSVVGFTGGRQTNSGFVFVSLKPLAERLVSADVVVNRLRGKLAEVPGARLFLQAAADLRTGGRQSNAMYQFTLQGDDTTTLYRWAPRLTAAMQKIDVLTDVNSDQQQGGLLADINIDRPTVARLGLTLNAIDNTLDDAFGQRQVSTIYAALNQYHVVMEVAPRYWQDPAILETDLGLDIRRQSFGHAEHQRHRRHFFRLGGVSQRRLDDRRRFGAQSGDQFDRRDRPFQRLGRALRSRPARKR